MGFVFFNPDSVSNFHFFPFIVQERKITEDTCKWDNAVYMYSTFAEATCVKLLLGDYRSFMTVVKMDVSFGPFFPYKKRRYPYSTI